MSSGAAPRPTSAGKADSQPRWNAREGGVTSAESRLGKQRLATVAARGSAPFGERVVRILRVASSFQRWLGSPPQRRRFGAPHGLARLNTPLDTFSARSLYLVATRRQCLMASGKLVAAKG